MFESLAGEHILVTGGTGFVGFNIVKKLQQIEDIKITSLSRTTFPVNKNVNHLKCDLTNKKSAQMAFNKIEDLDRVLHLASLNPKTEHEDLYENINQNLMTSINLLENMPGNIKGFVYSSTIDVYGLPKYNPINEKHPTNPLTYYAACKLSAEKFLKILLDKKRIPLTILRYSQIYGPGEPQIKAIPVFINKIKNNEHPILYGEGNDVRDYVFIEDVLNATLLALSKNIEGVFNIGTGKGYQIKEILKLIINIYGKDLSIEHKPSIKNSFTSIYDLKKANDVLNYYPCFGIREGLEKTINSLKK